MSKKLIILGNGFDLNIGLESKFGDFIYSYYLTSNDLIKSFFKKTYVENHKKWSKNLNDYSYKTTLNDFFTTFLISIDLSNDKNDFSNEFTSLIKNLPLNSNFWAEYLLFNKYLFQSSFVNWNDVESCIYDFFKSSNDGEYNQLKSIFDILESFLTMSTINSLKDTTNKDSAICDDDSVSLSRVIMEKDDFIKSSIVIVYCIINDTDLRKIIKNQYLYYHDNNLDNYRYNDRKNIEIEIVAYLRKQLECFEIDFNSYLNDKIFDFGEQKYNDRSLSIMESISGGSLYDVINFNYTQIPKNDLMESNVNIHGHLVNDMDFKNNSNTLIIGIDGRNVSTDSSYYQFTKTFRTITSRRNQTNTNILNRDINEVCIYGHSLSDADYSYFSTIFDKYMVSDLRVKLTFYYSTYKVNGKYISDEQAAIKTFKNVSRLIGKYGSYNSNNFNLNNNDPYGDELLKKLMISGKIELRKL